MKVIEDSLSWILKPTPCWSILILHGYILHIMRCCPPSSAHNLIPAWIDASGEGTDQSRRTKSWDDVWTGKIGLVSGIFFNIVQAHIDIYIYRVLWQHLMALSIGYR